MLKTKAWLKEWLFKLIVGGLLAGAFGFAWDTNANVAVLQTEVDYLKDRMAESNSQNKAILGLLRASGIVNGKQDEKIANNKENFEKHEKLTVGAHK